MNNSGFTLVETAIVVLIIGLLAAVIVPSLSDIGRLKLHKNGMRVAHTISYLYAQAAARKVLLRLEFNVETGEYYVAIQNDDGEFEVTRFSLFSKGHLSKGVRIASFTTLFSGEFSGETAYMHFLPEGLAEKSVIVLSDREGRKISLIVNPLTGRVTLEEGKTEFEYLEIAA